MMLALTEGMMRTHKFDAECATLADAHYSRRTVGDRQFMPPGRTLILRDSEGLAVFGWNWQLPEKRADREVGYCCSIFRNESSRRSSEIILECEQLVFAEWGRNRVFTYINPRKILSPNPGYCFKVAGWKFVRVTDGGLHLLAKGMPV